MAISQTEKIKQLEQELTQARTLVKAIVHRHGKWSQQANGRVITLRDEDLRGMEEHPIVIIPVEESDHDIRISCP